MRRFEMRAGSASKFWEIEVRGTALVVRFGRIGTDGQTKLKDLTSATMACAEADKLVREKLGKGYVEVGATKGKATTAVAKGAKPAKPVATKVLALPSIPAVWERIERWFARRPELVLGLRPGVKETSVAAAEKALGVRLPDDFRASLLVHDGQESHAAVEWLPVAQQLGSLAAIVSCWTDDRKYYDAAEMKERMDWLDKSQRVRQVHLHPQHIPFAGSPYWDYGRLMIDFIPGPKGTFGQVIARDDIDLIYIAPSFGAFLERIAIGLERGTIKTFNRD